MEHFTLLEFGIQEAVTIGLTVLRLWVQRRAQRRRRRRGKLPSRNATQQQGDDSQEKDDWMI